jgi:hypothetical protein
MVTLKGLSRILAVGEKNIFREISEILAVAEEANRVMRQMMHEHQSGVTMSDLAQAIRLLEKKSDDIAFKVGENITSGAISPNVLDDLLESVRLADTILDLYYNVSREMNRMSKVELEGRGNGEDDEWGALFLKMSDLAGKAILKVEELLATSNLVRMVEVRKEIETLEEQGDEVKDSGFDKLYALAPKLNYIQFVHYSEMLHKLDDILDACEDLSDMIVSIVNSILK